MHSLCVTWFFLILSFAVAQDLWDTPEGRARIFDAVVKTFAENYWDSSYRDWDAWSSDYREVALAAETRSDFDSAMRRMVNSLNDEHSRWLGRRVVPEGDDVPSASSGSPGLGVQHSYLPGSGIVLERVFPETPASKAGLQRGDVIVRIDGEDVREISSRQVSDILSSSTKREEIALEVRRRNQRLSVQLRPELINFGYVRDLPEARMLDASTGYIYLPSFLRQGVAQDVHTLIAGLQEQGATSLVLDLRDNPGGRLDELGLVLGAFIEGDWAQAMRHGELVWTSSYTLENGRGKGKLQAPQGSLVARYELENPVQFEGPLAVIVSRKNSSAGEVSALVLQNFKRATIVGEKTHGNVEAIQDFSMPDGSVMMIAVANLEGIDGTDFTQGIMPDIEASESLQELARGFDAPLAEALKAVKALPFTPGKYF